jgi:hypothetical protein
MVLKGLITFNLKPCIPERDGRGLGLGTRNALFPIFLLTNKEFFLPLCTGKLKDYIKREQNYYVRKYVW